MRLYKLLSLTSLALLLYACGPTVVYEELHSTAAGGWMYEDVADFSFTITDTSQLYDLEVLVTHTDNFPYENFYLNIYTTPPTGLETKEMISLDVAGDFGIWNGDCSGEICEFEIPILLNTRYQSAGEYRIRLEQNSRDESLPAIQAVGLRLLEAE